MLASDMRKYLLFVLLVTAVTLISGSALAQQNKQEAAKHFNVGQDAYDKKDYPTAVKEFVTAYQIAPINSLLFNIGQAYRLSGDKEKALAYYEKYVEFEPAGAQIPEAKQHIGELKEGVETAKHEQQLKDEEAARQKAEADARAAEEAKAKADADARARAQAGDAGKGLKIGGIVVGAVGVAAVGVGIAVAAGSSTGAGIGIAGAGVAAIGAGTAMYIVGRNQQRDALAKAGQTSMIVPTVAPGFYGAAWVGSF
jgi:tetratricopeptide (TPR) repeat protein